MLRIPMAFRGWGRRAARSEGKSLLVDIRPVLFINGILLLILAAAMGVPLLVDLATEHREWQAFALPLMITGFIGLALIFTNQGDGTPLLRTRQAFLLTGSSWLAVAIFSALPFQASDLPLSWTDCYFETISGITTTGATVLTGLDLLPHAILMWRALLQWLGGAGVILTAVVLLPVLRIGGMQMFHMANVDEGERATPRLPQMAWKMLGVYALFSALLAGGLCLAGMTPLEAVCHAMSSLATGGFSTSDQSLGHFSHAARWLCMLGMIAGGATFSQYVAPWRRGHWTILGDSQLRWYLLTIAVFAMLVTFWNWAVGDMEAREAFFASAFNVVSVLTTSGFHAGQYDSWGGFAQVAFFVMMFIGGCTGSTAGGIKIFRYQLLFAVSGVHIRRLLHPHGVFPVLFNRFRVSDPVVRSILGFVLLYFVCFAVLVVALTLSGLDTLTSFSGAAASLGNIGPGLGPLIGPGGSYQALPDFAKWLLTFGMLLGRLELVPLLILFTPAFWRE